MGALHPQNLCEKRGEASSRLPGALTAWVSSLKTHVRSQTHSVTACAGNCAAISTTAPLFQGCVHGGNTLQLRLHPPRAQRPDLSLPGPLQLPCHSAASPLCCPHSWERGGPQLKCLPDAGYSSSPTAFLLCPVSSIYLCTWRVPHPQASRECSRLQHQRLLWRPRVLGGGPHLESGEDLEKVSKPAREVLCALALSVLPSDDGHQLGQHVATVRVLKEARPEQTLGCRVSASHSGKWGPWGSGTSSASRLRSDQQPQLDRPVCGGSTKSTRVPAFENIAGTQWGCFQAEPTRWSSAGGKHGQATSCGL